MVFIILSDGSLTDLQYLRVFKVPAIAESSASCPSYRIWLLSIIIHVSHLCANQALVTAPNFSLHPANLAGFAVKTTTLFWTVLLVTSSGRRTSSRASSCRAHDMPKTEDAVGTLTGRGEVARDVGSGVSTPVSEVKVRSPSVAGFDRSEFFALLIEGRGASGEGCSITDGALILRRRVK